VRGSNFKGCPGVIIKSPDKSMVDGERNFKSAQTIKDSMKMNRGSVREVVD
jgi:hypothetical protein